MKENRSLCQVEQLPCACLLDSAAGCHWKTHARNGTAAPIRHRANGAVGSLCNSPNCSVAARLEGPEEDRRGPRRVLVTGGSGYFGFRLGQALARQGVSVILLDLHKPPWDIPDGAAFYQNDIRDFDALYKISAEVDVVFHTASYGMSGPEQLRKKQVESVNVGGTNNVINVCTERGISRLIYTSTVNVTFAGRPIEDGDEDSVPCVPLDMVNVERRLFSFCFGNPNAKMNWVHVDNLVTAHVLAAEGLTTEKSFVASGQAYFINDGEAVNVFEWLTPLFERLGYGRPLIHLPVSLVYSAAILMERLHVALSPIVEIPLLLTRNEVRTIAVSHTFKIEKARRDLGFCPKKYSLTDSVDHYLRTRPPRPTSSLTNTQCLLRLLLLLVLGFIVLMLCSAVWE
ncbi:putative short-chain dehydrogenase/reductase family 42E member 2 [Triplophysa tibetana]|uniref:Putative short-chain dehydrogenase/reductase family 42E member 2 n=1 Tax=Triplophysa tibetana TaxID=1572043 RepID=A0A5A9N8C9_9TELE|nr:putative short-chain dehydrogenase/reductase family 42E member 2 [Triplophysa tibetana]